MTPHRAFHAAALAALLALAAPFAAHAAVDQVADIYTGPGRIQGSLEFWRIFQSRNGLVFFDAETPSDGYELWASDGTAAGTHRLTDAAGGNDSDLRSTAFLGNEFYFVIGNTVWKSDGTSAGTKEAFEPVPGPSGERILKLAAVNGALYFDVLSGTEFSVWTSDGTQAGTRKIKTINPDQTSTGIYYFAAAGGDKVVFNADDGIHGEEPWVTNGTAGGTTMLKDIVGGGSGSDPRDFIVLNDKAFFCAGGNLWVTDGSAADTHKVTVTNGTNDGQSPGDLTIVDGKLYFRAFTGLGIEFQWRLWTTTDGTTTTLIDTSPTGYENDVSGLMAAGTDLYLTASNAAGDDTALLKWDGTNATTVLALGSDSIPASAYLSGKLYFAKGDFDTNTLFVSDGITATPLKDISVSTMAVSGGKLFLVANDGTHGYEPWVSDGTAANTRMIANLAPADTGSDPGGVTAAGGKLLFDACEPDHGCEPWISDGAAAGTRLLQDIAPGTDESDPYDFTAVGDTVYFVAIDSGGDELLWKVAADGSGATSVGTGFDDPEDLVAFNGELYFAAWTIADSQYELWKSDGTAAGTVVVSKDADIQSLTAAGSKLFFGAWGPGDADPQLWVSDGTGAGTMELTNGLDDIDEVVAMDGDVYFTARDGTHGDEVWVSDGTVAGTRLVKDVVPGAEGSDPYELTAYDGYLYFVAFTAEAGYEVWRTDGTADGTALFADIDPGARSSDPDELTAAGSKLYFTARTPAAGYELWATDGGKPVQVEDISPGPKGSEPVDLTPIGNRVVFTSSDGVTGYEPWISDGTAAGTHMIGDVNIGADSSNPDNYVFFKRQLFFAADDGNTGYELWRADINRRPVAADASATIEQDTALDGTLKASDPDGDALTFGIADVPAHGKVNITDASTGAFTYTSADGYSGKDSFRFNADDGLASASATVSIQVQGDTAPPHGDTTPPSGNGGGDAAAGGSGGGGAWGLLGGLLMLGALSRKRSLKRR